MRTDTSKGFRLLENSRNQKRTDTGYEYRNTLCSTDTPLSVPIRYVFKNPQRLVFAGVYRYERKVVPVRVAFRTDTGNYRTDTRRPKANSPQRLYAYRYRDKCTGTLCTRSADLAAKSTSTAPKHPQRSPTASR
ncbi:hypothetical protein V6N11_049939 [Hibiscus sabdariffa]|uniref:Uncharacterized protein n=1 Tax=Hibiscus sabdariffa TaxID=183260 RepID=A0ABR2T8Y8_9ROSI